MSALADFSKRSHIVLRCTICGPLGLLLSVATRSKQGIHVSQTRLVIGVNYFEISYTNRILLEVNAFSEQMLDVL